MKLTYFKRYRMEIDLTDRNFTAGDPARYRFLPWNPSLLEACALAKYYSFRDEIDANVFPCLGDLAGCRRLMTEISKKPGFLPGATWLAVYAPDNRRPPDYCGTIQGIRDPSGFGSIQNVAVTPEHRDCGVGTSLLVRSLHGFREAGVERVYLEATAQNEGAIRLYHRLGFTTVKTVFKAVEGVCT
jgi:ribosomal protein S18 acetylase RimI-like enzyme